MDDASNGILLSIITDVFTITDRGCVVLPGVPYPSATVPVLRRGASVVLRRPDGTELPTSIRELEMINRRPAIPFIPVLLPANVTKEEVPVGTELWYFPTANDTYVENGSP